MDANSVLYGKISQILFSFMKQFMQSILLRNEQEYKENKVTSFINRKKNCVDIFAKVKWLEGQGYQVRFDAVKNDVVRMYSKTCGVTWCCQVADKAASFFSST